MNALAKKLQIKPASKWLFLNIPAGLNELFEPLPDGVTISHATGDNFNGALLFVKTSAELDAALKSIANQLKADTVLWVIYPKKNSGIETNLEMMSEWDVCKAYGLRPVASAAIDAKWTGLRFKNEKDVKTSEGRNEAIKQNEYSEWVDVDNKQIKLPPDVAAALQQNSQALNFYEQLSYSNKKEYVLWIVIAKQEKTRTERLEKMIDKLSAGKKNPSEK